MSIPEKGVDRTDTDVTDEGEYQISSWDGKDMSTSKEKLVTFKLTAGIETFPNPEKKKSTPVGII